jgi:hypothetical protein
MVWFGWRRFLFPWFSSATTLPSTSFNFWSWRRRHLLWQEGLVWFGFAASQCWHLKQRLSTGFSSCSLRRRHFASWRMGLVWLAAGPYYSPLPVQAGALGSQFHAVNTTEKSDKSSR